MGGGGGGSGWRKDPRYEVDSKTGPILCLYNAENSLLETFKIGLRHGTHPINTFGTPLVSRVEWPNLDAIMILLLILIHNTN